MSEEQRNSHDPKLLVSEIYTSRMKTPVVPLQHETLVKGRHIMRTAPGVQITRRAEFFRKSSFFFG